jgi:NAD(P)-dependent dehydrogenase (short-subunit alcohol dehydrogenase family)
MVTPDPAAVTPDGAVVVVTGGASGIGRALAQRVAADGARAVVVIDRDAARATDVAASLGGVGVGVGVARALDVSDEAAVARTIEEITATVGEIDIWCSNAGVPTARGLGRDADWDLGFRVHVLAHVYVARHLLPRMAARGRGHLLVTASAAGLLTEMDTAPYSVTKHGAVALAEWLAIEYGDRGVSVSCLCPQGVRTPMTAGFDDTSATLAAGGLIEPSDVADAVIEAWREGRFLILPHLEVAEYERRRTADRDRWLAGMRRLRARLR